MEMLVAIVSFLAKSDISPTAIELLIISVLSWIFYLVRKSEKQNKELLTKIGSEIEQHKDIKLKLEHMSEKNSDNYEAIDKNIEKISAQFTLHIKEESSEHGELLKTTNEVNNEVGKISAIVTTALSYNNKPIK